MTRRLPASIARPCAAWLGLLRLTTEAVQGWLEAAIASDGGRCTLPLQLWRAMPTPHGLSANLHPAHAGQLDDPTGGGNGRGAVPKVRCHLHVRQPDCLNWAVRSEK